MKFSYEVWVCVKVEKEVEKVCVVEEECFDKERCENDFEGWLEDKCEVWLEMLVKMKECDCLK